MSAVNLAKIAPITPAVLPTAKVASTVLTPPMRVKTSAPINSFMGEYWWVVILVVLITGCVYWCYKNKVDKSVNVDEPIMQEKSSTPLAEIPIKEQS